MSQPAQKLDLPSDQVKSPDWITPKQAAWLLGCDVSSFRSCKLLVTGRIPRRKRRPLYRRTEVALAGKIRREAGISVRSAIKVMVAIRDGETAVNALFSSLDNLQS